MTDSPGSIPNAHKHHFVTFGPVRAGQTTVTINTPDPRLAHLRFTEPYSIPAGTPILEAIERILR